jgi:serine protease Do
MLLASAVFALALVAAADAQPWSWLGVRIRDLSEQEMEGVASRHGIREGFGVVIVEVMPDTPAAAAGLKNGDIVVAFDDRPVVETRMLQRLIAGAPSGSEVRLTVLRPEGRRPLRARLTSMPRPIAGERVAAEFGFVLRESDAQGELGGARSPAAAPAVAAVIRGSAAEKAGLEVGDGILQINEQSVLTRDAAREALADVSPERPLRLTIRRGQGHLTLTLPTS